MNIFIWNGCAAADARAPKATGLDLLRLGAWNFLGLSAIALATEEIWILIFEFSSLTSAPSRVG